MIGKGERKPGKRILNLRNLNKGHKSSDSMQIAYVLEKFPSPTEYFVLNEILELEKKGFELIVLVIRKQKQYLDLPELKKIKSSIIYLPRIFLIFPFLSFILSPFPIIKLRKLGLQKKTSGVLKSFRDLSISLFFAHKLKAKQANHIHAHFAFIAVDIARILSLLLKVKYSFTAHAQDIYTIEHRIKQVIGNAAFTVTCTKYNADYLNKITDYKFQEKIFSVYHGIELSKWKPKEIDRKFNNSTIHILTIARLVEKKGLIFLLKALEILINENKKVNCTIIGEGPLLEELKNYTSKNQLHDFVRILDFMTQKEVIKHFVASDIFVLPCIVAKNGDRDGLPNVIMEAMAIGIPVISTAVSAIPEIIECSAGIHAYEKTGLLVPVQDEKALAEAILNLKNDAELYYGIVKNARNKVWNEFDIDKCTNRLIEVFNNNI